MLEPRTWRSSSFKRISAWLLAGAGRSGAKEGKAELKIWLIYSDEDERRLLEKLYAMVMNGADKADPVSGDP